MAQWAQLGELELKHLEACLRLTAKVSVEASIRDDLGLCKSMDFPSILFSRSTWVDRAPGYHILLLISINGKPLPREAAEMLEHSALKSRVLFTLMIQYHTLTNNSELGISEPPCLATEGRFLKI